MTVHEMLRERNLPPLLESEDGKRTDKDKWIRRREELLGILRRNFLGNWPENVKISFEAQGEDCDDCGGKGIRRQIRASLSRGGKATCFPFFVAIPKNIHRPVPVFVHLHFPNEAACGMREELLDRGYAIASVCYEEIEKDDSRPAVSCMADLLDDTGSSRWGKIGEWAFAGHCVADYLQTSPAIDAQRMAVIGHSRLGLTSLWCGANDPRFSLTVGINAGSLYRGSECEQFSDLMRAYTRYWFCPAFFDGRRDASDLPFDMHFLLSLIAPRHLLLVGASRDRWASPHSMMLAAQAANPAFGSYGQKGLIMPAAPQACHLYGEGRIGFYIREGTHYFGRDEWLAAMAYRERHQV